MTNETPGDDSEHKLNLRHLVSSDYPDLNRITDQVHPELGGA
tara:strand:+ start:806 stop:931 length:126 start_codon:yes stop_codon:yes gene_type:complete